MGLETIVARVLGLSPEEVSDALAYQDTPRWDSLRHLALILRLEEHFGVELSEAEAAQLTSVAAIRRFFDSTASGAATQARPSPSETHDGADTSDRRGRTAVTKIDGTVPEIRYRGYSVVDLAHNSTFEETAHCLLYGELPSPSQLADFEAWLISERSLDDSLIGVIDAFREEPAVNTVIAALAADSGWKGYSTFEELSLAMIARLPTIVATQSALAEGRPLPTPDPDLGHAANLLAMMRGAPPTPEEARALDVTFVMQMDHGFAPSATSTRSAVGVGANARAAVLAGISVFSGSLHAGAVAKAMEVQEGVTDRDAARTVAQQWRSGGGRPYGFGHRVHRGHDPRSKAMRDTAARLAEALGNPGPLRQTDLLVAAVEEEWRGTLRPNYDGYAAPVYRLLGLGSDIATAVFTCSRVVGLVSHAAEQLADSFVMPPPPAWIGHGERRPAAAPQE